MAPAELLVKELRLTVAVPALTRPPPSVPAELLVKELPLTVAVRPRRCRGRRLEVAELLVKVLPLTVAVPKLARPPPWCGGVAGEGAADHRRRPEVGEAAATEAELLVKVLPLTVAVPTL